MVLALGRWTLIMEWSLRAEPEPPSCRAGAMDRAERSWRRQQVLEAALADRRRWEMEAMLSGVGRPR